MHQNFFAPSLKPPPPPLSSPTQLETPLISFISSDWNDLCEVFNSLFGRLELKLDLNSKNDFQLRVIENITYITTIDTNTVIDTLNISIKHIKNELKQKTNQKLNRLLFLFLTSDLVIFICKSKDYLLTICHQLAAIEKILSKITAKQVLSSKMTPKLIIHFPFEKAKDLANLQEQVKLLFEASNLLNSPLFSIVENDLVSVADINEEKECSDTLDSLISLLQVEESKEPKVDEVYKTPLKLIKSNILSTKSRDWFKTTNVMSKYFKYKLEVGNNRIRRDPKDFVQFDYLRLEERLARRRCERSTDIAIDLYKSIVPSVYDSYIHDISILLVLLEFEKSFGIKITTNQLKRKAKQKVIDICYKYWKKDKEKCNNISITMNPCQLLRKYCKNIKCKSGILLKFYCDCGVTQISISDIFNEILTTTFLSCCKQSRIISNDLNNKAKVFKIDKEYDEFYGMKMFKGFIDEIDKLETFENIFVGLEYISIEDGTRIILDSNNMLKVGVIKLTETEFNDNIWPNEDISLLFKSNISNLSQFHRNKPVSRSISYYFIFF